MLIAVKSLNKINLGRNSVQRLAVMQNGIKRGAKLPIVKGEFARFAGRILLLIYIRFIVQKNVQEREILK